MFLKKFDKHLLSLVLRRNIVENIVTKGLIKEYQRLSSNFLLMITKLLSYASVLPQSNILIICVESRFSTLLLKLGKETFLTLFTL